MRFKIRRAKIKPDLHATFELYGEQTIALALGLGSIPNYGPLTTPQFEPSMVVKIVHTNHSDAVMWLTEKRDQAECRETRLEICEWAILIFVGLSVVHDFGSLIMRFFP